MLVYLLLIFLCGQCLSGANIKLDDDDFDAYPNKKASNRPLDEVLAEIEPDYWRKNAVQAINKIIHRKKNHNIAKNVILFMGDGMSIPTIAAARVYLGGEEKQLEFEKFPNLALSKTYCVDHQTPDSACSATSYLCGVKGNLGTIGVSAHVQKQNCSQQANTDHHVDSVARMFQTKGKRTGFVTTTRITHASPAGVYAHVAARQWESDTKVLQYGGNPKECRDIAYQFVNGDTGSNLNVAMGGGRKNFLPKDVIDEEGLPGGRSDNLNLIKEWIKGKEEKKQKYEYIWNKKQLFNINNNTDFLLGMFESDHMAYNLDRNQETDPSLAEMVEAAIGVLNKDNNGYFLFVEGGHIDLAHHESWAKKALDEVLEFNKAIQKAIEITDEEDTLIVVTADHAHTMSFSGYAERGSDILGYAGEGTDEVPYTILNYANGPGYRQDEEGKKRRVTTLEEMSQNEFRIPGLAPLIFETHGGDDVPIYARGPMSHLFSGVMEENVIPHILAVASCVSDEISCDEINKIP